MLRRISDLPPLLEPGHHEMTLPEVGVMGVKAFPLSKTRLDIWRGFECVVGKLIDRKIVCDLITDGSFLTEEIDPLDIDFTVCVTPDFYDSCADEQLELLEWIRDDFSIKVDHRCDCYLCVEYPENHPDYFHGIQSRAFWSNLYSESKVYKRQRGIAVIRLNEHLWTGC